MDDRDCLNIRIPVFLYDALKARAKEEGTSMAKLFAEWVSDTTSLYESDAAPYEYTNTSVRLPKELNSKMRELSKRDFRSATGLATMIIWSRISGHKVELCVVEQAKGEHV